MSGSNLTSGFIDLATYDEIEKYMYGGPDATTYFVRETRRSTWFTHVPVQLSMGTGNPTLGNSFSVNISRAGDYLMNCWLRVTLSDATVTNAPQDTSAGTKATAAAVSYVKNLGHNLIEEVSLRFNDLEAAKLNHYVLDFWNEFTVPNGKRAAYATMTGSNPAAFTSPTNHTLKGMTLNIPLPLFFTRDTGVALPTAALPYNEMRMHIKLRSADEIMVAADSGTTNGLRKIKSTDFSGQVLPSITSIAVWADYAIVSNEERQKMACAPRDMVIEQFQTNSPNDYKRDDPNPSFDIRFSHAIKALMFGVSCENTELPFAHSNYSGSASKSVANATSPSFGDLSSPFSNVSLVYENTNRLANMGADYFTHVCPYYNAPSCPDEGGYHLYSYTLDLGNLDPMGSTNYGKLTNVSISPKPSSATNAKNAGGGRLVVVAVNNNVIRISGGALGFPVL